MGAKKTVAFVSLGCAKNLVSSEQMLFLLKEAGYAPRADCDGADVAVVNTCGFIESAKKEAIDCILQLADLKKQGRVGFILVAGCLAERYRTEIFDEMPEVDALVGCGSFHEIADAVSRMSGGERPCLFAPPDQTPLGTPRMLSTPPYTAFLKVAEGCDNHCAYCVIPALRGSFRSRPIEDLLDEARRMVNGGVSELILVAQDTTRYGLDLYGERRLADLIELLCRLDGLYWIRLHYLYPDEVDDRLIDVVASQEKVVNYLDIPIQHCSDKLLCSMGRRGTKAEIAALIDKLRGRIPDLVLRTSLIVGLPGETPDDFEELCTFLKDTRFERAGVFTYSQEEGTRAAVMPSQVEAETARVRAETLMALQQGIMEDFHKSLKGRSITVLTEGYDASTRLHSGRCWADSPEVDGRVTFKSRRRVMPGTYANVRITGIIDGEPSGVRIG